MKDNSKKLAYSAPSVEVVALQTESFTMGSISDYNDNVIFGSNSMDEEFSF
jgi:hypothetical protein